MIKGGVKVTLQQRDPNKTAIGSAPASAKNYNITRLEGTTSYDIGQAMSKSEVDALIQAGFKVVIVGGQG